MTQTVTKPLAAAGLVINGLQDKDFEEWLALWDGNNGGQRNDEVTRETWNRLLSPVFPVHGFVARAGGKMAGLVHYILHPVTGHIMPVCYMQDLYVAPEFRKRGIGRALVEHLAAIGKNEGWARMYWLAESGNDAAQALYKDLGFKLDFTLHILPLD